MVTPPPSDESLMDAWMHGDAEAFGALLQRHGRAIKAFAFRMLRSDGEAEDVVADTFVRVATSTWRPTGSARGWLFTIARRLCLDVLRHRRTLRAAVPHLVELDWGAPTPNPEARALLQEQASWLEAGLARLPEEHREVLLLRMVHGLSAAEVAAVLGLAEDQVHSQVSYARKRLRAVLEEAGVRHHARGERP